MLDEKWIGRQIKLRPKSDQARCVPAMLESLNGDTAVVRPVGHKRSEKVSKKELMPWYSKNPDLKNEQDPYIVYDPETGYFWTGHGWSKNIGAARHYDSKVQVNRACGIVKAKRKGQYKTLVADQLSIAREKLEPEPVPDVARPKPDIIQQKLDELTEAYNNVESAKELVREYEDEVRRKQQELLEAVKGVVNEG